MEVVCVVCYSKISEETHCIDCDVDTCDDCSLFFDCMGDVEDRIDVDGDVIMLHCH